MNSIKKLGFELIFEAFFMWRFIKKLPASFQKHGGKFDGRKMACTFGTTPNILN